MRVKWLIQSNGVTRKPLEEEFFAKNLQMFDFAMIPFTHKIINLDTIFLDFLTNKDVSYVLKGGTRILDILKDDGFVEENKKILLEHASEEYVDLFFNRFKAGLFYDLDKFDQAHYSSIGLPMLNQSPFVGYFHDVKAIVFEKDMFVKPTSDGKSFAGKILPKGQSLEDLLKTIMYQEKVSKETIMFSEIKNVLHEFRFFIINDEVVTGSQYMQDHRVVVRNLSDSELDKKALEVAQDYALLYKPSDVFTLDICLESSGRWSIVEYNCFNCSGLYAADLMKLTQSMENFLIKKTTNLKIKSSFT